MSCHLHLTSIVILMELLTSPSSNTYVIFRRSVSGTVSASVIQKRSLDLELPKPEYVCPTTFLKRNTPQFGHMRNGSFVQIQQDSEHSFEATLVECTNGQFRPPCHGIDAIVYASECVTMYEWRSAYVRLPNLDVDFVPAEIQENKCKFESSQIFYGLVGTIKHHHELHHRAKVSSSTDTGRVPMSTIQEEEARPLS